MAQVTKTPVMVLQELTVKHTVPPPVYELIPELTKQGTHKNEFFYQVRVFDSYAYGTGSSKQIAKHDAAKNMLNQLQKIGVYHPAENPVQGFVPGCATLNDKPIKTSVNCIGTLCELCEENKIPQPQFEEISDVGPPHCRQFTYDCVVASVRTRATAGTKKQAKQLAAKEMLEKIKDMLPELAQECNLTTNQITEQDGAAVNKFFNLSTTLVRKPDLCSGIKDYDLIFKKIMEEKGISLNNCMSDDFTEDEFNRIINMLELSMSFVTIQTDYDQTIGILTLSTDPPPFCTIGEGKTEDEAREEAMKDAFNKIKSWIE